MMKSLAPDHERLLLEQVALGDRDAYALIYMHYTPRLYRFLYPFTDQSREEAEEVIQDVFLKIWMRRESLVVLRSFESYLFRMAKNQLIDTRKRSQRLHLIKDRLQPRVEAAEGDPYNESIYSEYLQAATEAVNHLTPQRRRIFEMRTQQDMGIDDIADALDITRSAVKKQLYEAIHAIKKHLHHETGWPLLLMLITWLC